MEKQSQSQSPLSARWACDEIVERLPGIFGNFFLHFDKERTPRNTRGEIKVTGGCRYSLALLKNDLFCSTVVPYARAEVGPRRFIYHVRYLGWYLQQHRSVRDTQRDGAFWCCFAKLEKSHFLVVSAHFFSNMTSCGGDVGLSVGRPLQTNISQQL